MIDLAFVIICAAGVFGLVLALLYLRRAGTRPPHPAIPAFHGGVGATGLAVLLAALGGGRSHSSMGTEGFGRTGAGLLALALMLGLTIAWASWRRRRPSGALIGAHAGCAIAGLVVLWALIALG